MPLFPRRSAHPVQTTKTTKSGRESCAPSSNPSSRSRRWPRESGPVALQQVRRVPRQQQRRDGEARRVDRVRECGPGAATSTPPSSGPSAVVSHGTAGARSRVGELVVGDQAPPGPRAPRAADPASPTPATSASSTIPSALFMRQAARRRAAGRRPKPTISALRQSGRRAGRRAGRGTHPRQDRRDVPGLRATRRSWFRVEDVDVQRDDREPGPMWNRDSAKNEETERSVDAPRSANGRRVRPGRASTVAEPVSVRQSTIAA